MASSLTTFANLLKVRYDSRKVADLTESHSPLMAKMSKDQSFQGSSQDIPLVHGNPQGLAAASLATAQASTSNIVSKKFQLTTGTYQASVSFGDKVMKASRGNEGAFMRNQVAEMDGLYKQVGMVQSRYLYGNGGGSIGQIATGGIAANVITLEEPSDVLNFEVNQYLVFSANDGSDSAHTVRAGSTFVTAVDREAGTVTVDDFGDVTGEAAGDYIFREGDFVGNTSTELFHGLQSFIPAAAPTTTLYGMTRTADPIRLGGARVPSADYSGLNNEERIMLLGAYMSGRYHGPGATDAFAHPEDWHNLQVALRSQGWQPAKDTSTRFGFQKIEVVLGSKLVNIYSDTYCPKGTFFALNMDHWKIHSMGPMIRKLDEDGLNFLRASTTNNYEYRLVSYMAPCTNAPGFSGRIPLTT